MLRANGEENIYPCIFSNASDKGCYQFVGREGGSSKGKIRPQFKFKSLKKRHYVIHVFDFAFRVNNPHPVYKFRDSSGGLLELSHLCHNKWCVNPSHVVRETHTANCARTQCKRHCKCKEDGRQPNCISRCVLNKKNTKCPLTAVD